MAAAIPQKTLTRWARDYGGHCLLPIFLDFHFYVLFHPQELAEEIRDWHGEVQALYEVAGLAEQTCVRCCCGWKEARFKNGSRENG